MERDEALRAVGTRVYLHDAVYGNVPAGTRGTVIHANLAHRFTDPEYGYADIYELVVAWDVPEPITTTMDSGEYALFQERV